jgi:hypothetical protein
MNTYSTDSTNSNIKYIFLLNESNFFIEQYSALKSLKCVFCNEVKTKRSSIFVFEYV